MTGAPPALQLVLPGTWLQVPLDDQVRVDRVVELVGQAGTDVTATEVLRAALRQLAASGGDQLLLRQDPEAPTVLVTAWRPRPQAGPVDADALREELGLGDAVQVPRPDDHVVLREPRTAVGGTPAATWWVAGPGRSEVLSVTVFLHGAAGTAQEQAAYDDLAASLVWHEDVRATA